MFTIPCVVQRRIVGSLVWCCSFLASRFRYLSLAGRVSLGGWLFVGSRTMLKSGHAFVRVKKVLHNAIMQLYDVCSSYIRAHAYFFFLVVRGGHRALIAFFFVFLSGLGHCHVSATWFAFSGHSLRAVGVVVGPLYVGTTACAFPTKSCCVFQNVAGCGFISR